MVLPRKSKEFLALYVYVNQIFSKVFIFQLSWESLRYLQLALSNSPRLALFHINLAENVWLIVMYLSNTNFRPQSLFSKKALRKFQKGHRKYLYNENLSPQSHRYAAP